jgi:hypothetical protein
MSVRKPTSVQSTEPSKRTLSKFKCHLPILSHRRRCHADMSAQFTDIYICIVPTNLTVTQQLTSYPTTDTPTDHLATVDCRCVNGKAGAYDCNNIDLLSFVPISALGSTYDASDSWGWTDPDTGDEIAIIAMMDGTVGPLSLSPHIPTQPRPRPDPTIAHHQTHLTCAGVCSNHQSNRTDSAWLYAADWHLERSVPCVGRGGIAWL